MRRRFLVIGCGSIGRRHLRNLCELAAGELFAWDPLPEQRTMAADESGAIPVESVSAALGSGVDAALICSPTALHAQQAIEAARHTNLFVEKPIAGTYEDAQAVADAVDVNRRICMVACNLRFFPGLTEMKALLESGEIGRPLAIRAEFGQYLPDWHPWEDYRKGYSARRDLGGGVLLDAIHELDLVRWLSGDYGEVQGVRGRTGTLEIETEDIALIVGRLESGVWFEVHLDYLQRAYARSCKIVGTKGTLLWDAPAGKTTLLRANSEPRTIRDFQGTDANEMYLAEMRHFLRCLDGQDTPAQDARAASSMVRVAAEVRWLE